MTKETPDLPEAIVEATDAINRFLAETPGYWVKTEKRKVELMKGRQRGPRPGQPMFAGRIDLTDKQAAGLAGPTESFGNFVAYRDITPGLALRVARSGRKTWTIKTVSMKTGPLTIGVFPDMSVASARKVAEERWREEGVTIRA